MSDEIEPKESEEQSDKPEEADKSDQANDSEEIKDQGPQWISELDLYPLREKDEDPKWALRTVWVWLGFASVSTIFILTMLVLGAIYD